MAINLNNNNVYNNCKAKAVNKTCVSEKRAIKNGSNPSFQSAAALENLGMFHKWGLKAASKVPESFFHGKFLEKLSGMAKDYPALFETLTGLGVTSTIRPLTIMITPGAKIEDRKYASVKSITSGIAGYLFSCAVYKPFGNIIKDLGMSSLHTENAINSLKMLKKATTNQAIMSKAHEAAQHALEATKHLNIDKTGNIYKYATKALYANSSVETTVSAAKRAVRELSKINKFPYVYDTAKFKTFAFIMNYGTRFVVAIPIAILTFKLIPPFMKLIFPKRNEKPEDYHNTPIYAAQLSPDQQRVYEFLVQSAQNNKGGLS